MVTFQMQCFSWSQNQPFARIFGITIAKSNYIMHIIGKISNMQNHIICSSLSFSLQCWQGDSIFISHVSIDCKSRRPRFCYWRKGFEPEQIRPSAVASNSVIWKKDILKSKTLLQSSCLSECPGTVLDVILGENLAIDFCGVILLLNCYYNLHFSAHVTRGPDF